MKLSTKNLPETSFAFDKFGEVICEWDQIMSCSDDHFYHDAREHFERKMNEATSPLEAAHYLRVMLYVQHRAERERGICV